MLRKFVYVRQRNGVAENEKSIKHYNQNIDADTRNTTKKAIKRPGDVPTRDGRHKTQSRDFKYKTLFKERRRKTPARENDGIRSHHDSYYDDWQRGHVPLNYEHFLFDKTSCESKRCNPRRRETFVLDEPELTKVEIISNGSVRTLFVQKKENAVRMDNNVSRGKNTCLCEKENYGEGFLCKGMAPRIKVCDATIRKTNSVCSPISHSLHTPCQKPNTYSKNKWRNEKNGGEKKLKVQFSSKNNCTTFTDQNDYQPNIKQEKENRKQHQINGMNNTDTHKKSKEQLTYTKNTEAPVRHICDINNYEKEEEHFIINLPGVRRETKSENMPFESMLDNIHEFNEATQYSRQIFPRETKTGPKKPRRVPQNKEKEYLNYELDSKTNDFTDKDGVFDGNDDHEVFISYLEDETSDSEDTKKLVFLSHSPTVLSFYPRKKNNSNFELDRKEFHKTDSNDTLLNEKDSDILSCSEKKFNFGQICPNMSKFTLDILNSTPELQNEIYFNAQDPSTQKSTTDARAGIRDKLETFPNSSDSDFKMTISTDESVNQPYEKDKIQNNEPMDGKSNVMIEENHWRFLNDPYLEYKNSDVWKKNLLDKYDFKHNLRLNIDESKTSPRKPFQRIDNSDLVVTKDNSFLSNDSSESAGNHVEYKSEQIRNINNLRSEISSPKNLKLRIGKPKTAVLPAKNSYDRSLVIDDDVSSEELKSKPNIHAERHFEKPAERIHYPNSNSNFDRNYIIENSCFNDDSNDDDSGDNANGDNNHEYEQIPQKIEDENETRTNPDLKIVEPSIVDNSNYKPFMYSHISDSELKNFKKYLKKVPNLTSKSNNIVYRPESKERLTDNRCFDRSKDNDDEYKNISDKMNDHTTTKSIPVLRIGEPSNLEYIPFMKNSLSKIKLKTEKDFRTELGLKKSSLKASKVNSDLNDRFKFNVYQEILDNKGDYGDNNHSDSSGDNNHSDDSTDEETYNVDNNYKVKDIIFKVDQLSRQSILNNTCINKNNYRSRFLEKGMLRNKDCIADTGIKIVETTPLNPVAELRPLFEMKAEPTVNTPIQPHKKKKERLKRCASVGVTTANVECLAVLPHKSKQAMFQYELAEDGWLAEKKGIVGLKDLHKGELNIDDDINHVIKMYSSACIALGNIKLMF